MRQFNSGKPSGPKGIPEDIRAPFFTSLGIAPLPEAGSYFVDLDDFQRHYIEAETPASDTPKPNLDAQLYGARRHPWDIHEFPQVAKWLELNEQPLALVLKGSQRKKCYSPLVKIADGPSVGSYEQASLANLTYVVEALLARAMLHVASGQLESAVDDSLAAHRVARLAGQTPDLLTR